MFTMRFDMRAPGKSADERAALYRAAIDMAAWADTRGCASIVLSEHHASDDGYLPSPFPMAAAMAAVTSTTPIVVAAALLPLYEPVRLAEDLIVLDHLCRGRAMFVMALGYRPVEYELHGVDYQQRGRIADEKFTALLGALRAARAGTGAPALTPPPFSADGPTVAWGGATKAAARRAGRNGVPFFAQTDRPGLREAYEEAARDAGHEPGMCILPSGDAPLSTFVHDDVDTGWREVGEALLADAVPYFEWNEAAGSADYTVSLSRSRTVDELRAERGSHRVVTVADAAAIIRTHGVLSLQPLCGGVDPELAWRYLRRVVDEVLPAAAAG
jgi:alkanesulfonate monooxygenase SsuD/methylene tetrahydromethanopterin reductase-like flavin-dependent oxidoreductase (luciferase family)